MTRQRRYRSRQGVVYGQTRPRDGTRSGGVLIGQALGLIVVVAAMAVLGVGALSLIGDEAGVAAASPSPTSVAFSPAPASPTPVTRTLPPPPTAPPSPTIAPAASFTPVPSFGALPTASAGAPPDLQVRVGPGYVTFGTQRNGNLLITNPRTQFAIDERILWSAALSEPTNTWLLSITIHEVNVADGTERLVDQRGERARVGGAELVSSSLVPRQRLDGPAIYVMRYSRGSQLLAQGYFQVTGN